MGYFRTSIVFFLSVTFIEDLRMQLHTRHKRSKYPTSDEFHGETFLKKIKFLYYYLRLVLKLI